jgi:hypothetical protein
MDIDRTPPSEFSTGIEPNTDTPNQQQNQDLVTPTAHESGSQQGIYEYPLGEDGDGDMLAEVVRKTSRKMQGASVVNLRSKESDLDKDNWMYEAPRYTYK